MMVNTMIAAAAQRVYAPRRIAAPPKNSTSAPIQPSMFAAGLP
jgi:hypothetical protein